MCTLKPSWGSQVAAAAPHPTSPHPKPTARTGGAAEAGSFGPGLPQGEEVLGFVNST